MKIAFLMDPLASINPTMKTTSQLMYECNQRGHTVYFLEPHDIYIRRGEIVARMRNISVPLNLSMKKYWRSVINCLKQKGLIFETVTELDVLFIRKKPPVNYQALEFLAPVNQKVFMVNSINGLSTGNSKLYALNFPDIIPETHVSRDPKRLMKIIDDFGGAMVVKPLQRFGGEGVIKVSTKDRENLNSLINYYVRGYEDYQAREPVMVQEYLDVVKKEGDVRILLLNGEILGAIKRKPLPGEFRTNIYAGGRIYRHEITTKEREICRVIKDRLILDGLFFVGIDIIGNKLVEINCVNPGGIPRINQLNNDKLEVKVIDFVEQSAKDLKG
ncbi:MAG: glutathione synthase [Desulfobacterales bacterium]|uniref:Glutathione synthetase n=1 Tax=Candidatus Desulfatibia vada TaxID=2841696 RepID=A0A8J6TTR5_9BACT|nr:glutathione synthase [Candidatus Desulfatibia vada]MBL6972029.1 glutathione synthase [Desulfobacterales bacterium]